MIKYDVYKYKDFLKRWLIALGIISILLSFYTAFLCFISFLGSRSKRFTFFFRIYCVLMMVICVVWIKKTGYGIEDFISPYNHPVRYYFLIDNPGRWIIAAAYGLFYSFFSHLLFEGMEEWVVQQKMKEQAALIPVGVFNYNNRSHMILLGCSGSGKGVCLNHIIRHCFCNNTQLIVISAKLARTDKYSQLAYCRKMAKMTGRKLYIVSMDESIPDRCKYNPFKYLLKQELMNALESMLQTDSHFYYTNFSMWFVSIFKALKACKQTISMYNILDLYDYEDYVHFLREKLEEEIIDEEKFKSLTTKKIKNFAETAVNDAANLQLICEACESVFNDTPNHTLITITDAMREGAVIYFDLNGNSSEAATKLLGSCILAEIQHVMTEFSDPNIEKTCICDECSFYMTPLLKSLFNESRSAGNKMILSTQGPSDFTDEQRLSNCDKLISQLSNNCGQFGILRMNSRDDAQLAADLLGTVKTAENTHRAESISYNMMGSVKAVDTYVANPNIIKNLNQLECIYLEKKNDGEHIPKPVLVKWRVDDL